MLEFRAPYPSTHTYSQMTGREELRQDAVAGGEQVANTLVRVALKASAETLHFGRKRVAAPTEQWAR